VCRSHGVAVAVVAAAAVARVAVVVAAAVAPEAAAALVVVAAVAAASHGVDPAASAEGERIPDHIESVCCHGRARPSRPGHFMFALWSCPLCGTAIAAPGRVRGFHNSQKMLARGLDVFAAAVILRAASPLKNDR
jgi:hypothetical protein